MSTPRLEFYNGSVWYNAGQVGDVEVISQKRVIIAGIITGIFSAVMGSAFGRAGQILGTLGGVITGIELGEKCPIKEKGIVKYRIKSDQEIEKDKILLKIREFQDKWFPCLISRDTNPFKWIWPS